MLIARNKLRDSRKLNEAWRPQRQRSRALLLKLSNIAALWQNLIHDARFVESTPNPDHTCITRLLLFC